MRHLLFFVCLFLAGFLAAQSYSSRIHRKVRLGDPDQVHQLILLDYTKLLGVALDVTTDSIYFQIRDTEDITAVPIEELRFLGLFTYGGQGGKGGYGGGGDFAPVGLSDLTYERTALPPQSKGQLRIVQLLYAVTEWNLNDNVQLGVGLASPVVLATTQKFRWSLGEQFHLGVSNQLALPITEQGFNDGTPLVVGDLAGMVTLGNENRFFNIGTGWFYNTDVFVDSKTARNYRLGLGGRISSKWYLYGEAVAVLSATEARRNFPDRRELVVLPTVNAALAVRRHRWNFGLASVIIDQEAVLPVPIPYLGYSLYWGKL